MADKKARLVIDDLRGGRNGYDPPWALKDNECADAVNVDFYQSPLGHRRGGMATGGWAFGTMGAQFPSLFRHVPTSDETTAEFWLTTSAATPQVGRAAATTAIAPVTLKDAFSSSTDAFTWIGASINGKLAQAYKTAQNRMHFWDPNTATVRRGGLAATVAPTAADTGGGAYPAVLRYYRQRSTRQVGGVTVLRSEPSPSVSFTPSGAGTAARVTQAAVINESETHWEVEASIDNVTFYRIATVVIGTTTYDDSAVVTTYNTNPLSATTGTYTLQKSYRFIAVDQARLIGFGSNTSTDKQNDIEVSAVIGSLDVGDEERVDTTTNYRIGLDENDSGSPTGLGGPVDGFFFPFKRLQTWMLTPTGSPSLPYRADALSKSIGCVSHKSIVRAEDAKGNPALYWMSHQGPYRWSSARGMEYIGHGIEDLVLGQFDPNKSTNGVPAHGFWYVNKRQVWMWIGRSNDYFLCIYDVKAGAWSRVPPSDQLSFVLSAIMFAATIGATMSLDLSPYISALDSTAPVKPNIFKADTGSADLDEDKNAVAFQAYITTKAYEPGGAGLYGEVGDGLLTAAVATGITVSSTTIADFGVQSKTSSCLLTPDAAESFVTKRLQDSGLSGDVRFVQFQLGDAAASTAAWNLSRLVVPVGRKDPASQ